jgi:hypothetical protein
VFAFGSLFILDEDTSSDPGLDLVMVRQAVSIDNNTQPPRKRTIDEFLGVTTDSEEKEYTEDGKQRKKSQHKTY